ncbi:MAG TPA: rcc01693 family protein [Paracoccaceae bacterium]|nr:rcc01693 family protein [Paracoccaceae bacterium]
MADRVAWPRLMRLGMGRLGLAPEVFWSLTPAELLVMAGIEGGATAGMTRAALRALEAQFPDGMKADGGFFGGS